VLVVEDDHLVAMALEQALLDAGLVVVGIAVSADEAVAMALGQRPDLAVMDVRLLGARDGIEAAIDIFNGTGIRCIFATAHSDASTRHRAQAAQPLGWLAKPYTPRALVQAVRTALDSLRTA
jgi:DNA-binding NarL/FixJ family response regulator